MNSLPSMNDSQVIVLDGGFSSQLSTHVGPRMDGDPLWTASFLHTSPEEILATHLDFLRAGADCISTNTYQASIGGFMTYLKLTQEESYELIDRAVKLAKQARDIYLKETKSVSHPLIAGSVGPYGAHLHDASEYSGNYANRTSAETMRDWHRPRIETLIKSGVDILALETVPCEKEAEMLVNLLKEYPDVKAWLTFSCHNGKTLANGEDFQKTAKKCLKLNPDQLIAVGVNCCSPIIVEELFNGFYNDFKDIRTPLITYPNSGETYTSEEGWVGGENVLSIDKFVKKWLGLGVRYVGGCCRTKAEDITRIKNDVRSWYDEKN